MNVKPLAFILSLIVIVLSVAPCCALTEHIKEAEEKIVPENQNPDQDEDCCQDCSPFYRCGTCGGFMATSLISFNTPASTLIPTSFNNAYFQSFADGIDQNIWQPPKLS